MWKRKLATAFCGGHTYDEIEQLRIIKKCRFDGFFTEWQPGFDLVALANEAEKIGLELQSVHLPMFKIHCIWDETEEAEAITQNLLTGIREISGTKTPIVVLHSGNGQEKNLTNAGLDKFRRLFEEAAKYDLKVGVENCEGVESLKLLMDTFGSMDNVGFCWDSGHEVAFNRSVDQLALYGDKLICTHLQDNYGITDPDGRISYDDDLHMLPFDGVIDWDDVAERLAKCNYTDYLTLELQYHKKEHRHDRDKYTSMPYEQFVAESYGRVARIATMLEKKLNKIKE